MNKINKITGLTIPRSIRMLTQFGGDALLPSIVKGRYIAPLVSKRIAADLKKRAKIEGTYGEFVPYEGIAKTLAKITTGIKVGN